MARLDKYLEPPETWDTFEDMDDEMMRIDRRINEIANDPELMLEAIDEYCVLNGDGKGMLAKLIGDIYDLANTKAIYEFVKFVDMCIKEQAIRETLPEELRRQAE